MLTKLPILEKHLNRSSADLCMENIGLFYGKTGLAFLYALLLDKEHKTGNSISNAIPPVDEYLSYIDINDLASQMVLQELDGVSK